MALKQRKGGRKKGSSVKRGGTPDGANGETSNHGRMIHPSSRRRDGSGGGPAASRWINRYSDKTLSIVIFLSAFLVYLSDGGFNPGNDMAPNLYLPLQFFRGKVWWTVFDAPILFHWKVKPEADGGGRNQRVYLGPTMDGDAYDESHENMGLSGRDLLQSGRLIFSRKKYVLTPVARDADDDDKINSEIRYVNTFNLGTAVTFTPAAAVLAAYHRFDLDTLQSDAWLLWRAGKVAASLLVAGAGSFLYLSARTFPSVSQPTAVAAAFVYCFCTCAWCVSSQGMSQHAPNAFYLSGAVLALSKAERGYRDGRGWSVRALAACGFTVGMATLARPTSAVVALAVGLYLLLDKRSLKATVVYGSAGSALAFLQLYYNYFCFENPWEFGQQQASRKLAVQKTGSSYLWQTPLLTGMSTLLFSPSRGLFVFSPLTLLALPAFYLVWLPPRTRPGFDAPGSGEGGVEKGEEGGGAKNGGDSSNEFAVLRPLVLSVLLSWTAAFKFYDYWGGWCYGYRPLVDTMPMMALFLCATASAIRIPSASRRNSIAGVLAVMAAWSIAVQYVGVRAFDVSGWNNLSRLLVEVEGQTEPVVVQSAAQLSALVAQHGTNMKQRSVSMDIDKLEYRHRLWSWSDWQIRYYFQHFRRSKRMKEAQTAHSIKFL